MWKHPCENLHESSLKKHITVLEENLQWSKMFLKNLVMRKICNKINSRSCGTCEMIKKNIPEVKELTLCLNGPSSSSSKELSIIYKYWESHLDTFNASSSKSLRRNLQKKSNIYPPSYVTFLEKKFRKQIRRIRKTVSVSEKKHLKIFTARKRDKPCNSNKSNKIGNIHLKELDCGLRDTSNLNISKYNYVPFTKHISTYLPGRNSGNRSFLIEHPNSPDLVENKNSTGSRRCSTIINVADSDSFESRSSSPIACENPRSVVQALNFSSIKCIGPNEISRIKKKPELQPYVKLIDMYKTIRDPIVSQEKSHSTETENNSIEGDKKVSDLSQGDSVASNTVISKFEKKQLRPRRNAVNELNSRNIKRCFRPFEMYGIRKNPKMQPYVKLIDIYKRDTILPQEVKSKVCENISTQYEKIVPTDLPSLGTIEEINLVTETASIEAEHKGEEVCSNETMEVEVDSDNATEIMSVSGVENISTQYKIIGSTENTIPSFDEEMKVTETASTEAEHIAEKLCSDKTTDVESETERNDLSLVPERDNSEKNIRKTQAYSCTEELSSEEKKENNAELRTTDLSFTKNRALHSTMEREEYFEENKSEGSADPVVEMSALNQELETDKNSLFSCDLTLIRDPRTPPNPFLDKEVDTFSPLIFPASPDFADAEMDGILTPKSPPTPDRYPSMSEACSNFVPIWASRLRLCSPYGRGPRTPPGVPKSPEDER